MVFRLTAAFWLSQLLFATCDERPVEIVLARCRENIDWIEDFGYGDITTVYDKCGTTSGPGHHQERPNVGREGGTFLQHIVDNYDHLADWTVFSQAEKPTYGYRGHRLGGGHMMRNVQFKDYVEAGKTRQANPLFFVFTTVMYSANGHVFQCIRDGYGEDYVEPHGEMFQQKMCGSVADWNQWFEFPEWFTSMVQRLQAEQHAPLPHFDVPKALHLLGVQPTEGVTFFAQGARFAASREAIRARPKAYYVGLLEHLNHQDPWAGYYMEWLWYYVLGGSDAACGFEKPIVNSHFAWQNKKGRGEVMEVQAVSGVSGQSPIIVIPILNISIEAQLASQGGSNVAEFSDVDHYITIPQVLSTVSLIFNGALLQFQGSLTYNFPDGEITGRDLVLEDASTITAASITVTSLKVHNTAIISAPLAISSGTLQLGNSSATGIMTISSSASIVNTVISGQGTLRIRQKGKDVVFSFVLIVATITIELTTGTSGRRTDLSSSSLTVARSCGTVNTGTVVLGSSNVLFLDLSCTASTAGFTQYSNSVGTLTGSGGLLYLSGISSSSKATLISTWTGVSSTPIEIDNVASGTYCTTVLIYGASSCASSWSVTFDSCQSGATCTLTGGVYSGDNSKCQAVFCQSGGSSDSGSSGALYALIALVALIPLAGLACFGVWHCLGAREAAPAYGAYYYPQQPQSNAYPQANYPRSTPFEEAYPLQSLRVPHASGLAAPAQTPSGFVR